MSAKLTFRDPRPSKKVSLPSFGESEVEIWSSILARDLATLKQNDNQTELGIESLSLFIKAWNFTAEDGTDLPINRETIGKLPSPDLVFLFQEIEKFTAEQKKT